MSAPLLEASNLHVTLGKRSVVRNVSLTLRAGEFVALLGPNGAGKTTLIKAAAGLVALQRGTVRIGEGSMPRGQRCAYLEQGGRIHWPLAVRDIVALGRLPFGSSLQRLSPEDTAAIDMALEDCDLTHIAEQSTACLSGGEIARVLMARALAVQAPLLLADEPVASLDPAHQIATMQVLARQAQKGGAALVVLHDLALALRFAHRIVLLQDGAIVADDSPEGIVASKVLDRVFGLEFHSTGSGRDLLMAPRIA